MKFRAYVLLSVFLAVGQLCAEPVPLETEAALKSWTKTIDGVSPEDGWVKIEPTKTDLVKGRGLLGIWRSVNFRKYAGRDVILSVEMMQKNVSGLPDAKYSGSKFLVSFRRNGKMIYPGARERHGSAAWGRQEFRFTVPADGRFVISLGMQGACGLVGVRNLDIRPAESFADLSKAVNMGFADPKERDGVGGWSDQGPDNDAAGFDFRKERYANVPFRVIDPAENNGKSVLVFGSVNFPNGLERARIPVSGKDMKMLYLLHTACWAPETGEAGMVTLKGENGEQKIPVRFRQELCDQWNPTAQKNGLIGAVWNNRTGGSNGLYVSRFPVDPKIGNIEEIRLDGGKSGAVWIVAGITLSGSDFPLPKQKRFVVRAGERFRALKRPPTPQILPGSALDFSGLNTGKIERIIINKHGRLARESEPEKPFRFFAVQVGTGLNDHYVSQDDGKRKLNARAFWKDRERISALVREIRRHGCNMLRLHNMDMVTVKNGVAELNREKLDRWDWCIAECRKNGIYIQIDTMHVQGFSGLSQWSREGQARNSKFQLLFDPERREEYRLGMKALLEHVNPYTEMALKDDPVLAVLNYCNE